MNLEITRERMRLPKEARTPTPQVKDLRSKIVGTLHRGAQLSLLISRIIQPGQAVAKPNFLSRTSSFSACTRILRWVSESLVLSEKYGRLKGSVTFLMPIMGQGGVDFVVTRMQPQGVLVLVLVLVLLVVPMVAWVAFGDPMRSISVILGVLVVRMNHIKTREKNILHPFSSA